MENRFIPSMKIIRQPQLLLSYGFAIGAIFSSSVVAQDPVSSSTVGNPAAIHVGPFDVVPALGLIVEDDSNLFELPSDNEVDATLTVVSPSISATADNGVSRYNLAYELSNGTYSGVDGVDGDDDYTDHRFSSGFSWQANVRHRIALTASIEDGHNSRTNDSVTGLNVPEPNEFRDRDVGVNYRFGADGARGRVTVGVSQSDVKYTNNKAFDSDLLDSDVLRTDITVLLGLSATTRTVFQVINSETEFSNDSERDRDELSYLVGVEWQISEQTLGGVRVGRTNTDLVSPDLAVGAEDSFSNTTWQANITWAPRSYTSFAFEALRDTQNTDNDVGSFTDVAQYTATWNYDWTSRIRSSLSFGVREEDFIGSASNRVDDLDTMQLAVNYSIRRWLSAGIAFATEEQSSSSVDPNLEYDKDTIRAFVNMSL